MNPEMLKIYMTEQIEEIQKFKWCESERRGYDIGFETAAFLWIKMFAKKHCEYNKYKYL